MASQGHIELTHSCLLSLWFVSQGLFLSEFQILVMLFILLFGCDLPNHNRHLHIPQQQLQISWYLETLHYWPFVRGIQWILLYHTMQYTPSINSSPPGQNGCLFTDDHIFRCIFVNEKICILIKISLKFVPKGPIENNPALVSIMAWRRTRPHICGSRGRWVKCVPRVHLKLSQHQFYNGLVQKKGDKPLSDPVLA